VIRHVITFPGHVDPKTGAAFMEMFRAAADSRQLRDIAVTEGCTVQTLTPTSRKRSAFLSRARAKVR
jgi:hypothetical protein